MLHFAAVALLYAEQELDNAYEHVCKLNTVYNHMPNAQANANASTAEAKRPLKPNQSAVRHTQRRP